MTDIRKVTIEFEIDLDSPEGCIRETITDTHPDPNRRYLLLKCSSLIEEIDRVQAEDPDHYREFTSDSNAFTTLKRQLSKQKPSAQSLGGMLH